MAKARKSPCMYCDAKIGMVAFCTNCGKPTEWANHDQRVEYELRQWGNNPRAAAKTKKHAAVVSVREVAEATAQVASPLVRSTPTVREEMKVRKVELHPMAAKVRRAQSETAAAPAETAASIDIVPAPRAKKMTIKRHERRNEMPLKDAPAPTKQMPAPAPMIERASTPKAAPKVKKPAAKPAAAKKEAPAKKARAPKAKPAPTLAEKIAKMPAAKPVKREAMQKKVPAAKEVVIDLSERKTVRMPDAKPELIRLMERQIELLSEVVEKLSALEEKMSPASNGTSAFVEAVTNGNGHANGNGHKTRRFWFAKR